MKPRGGTGRSPGETSRPRAVVWTFRALSDLEAVGNYIARDSPGAAERWVLRLKAAGDAAGELPLAGRQVPELARSDVREKVIGNYRGNSRRVPRALPRTVVGIADQEAS